MIINFKDRENLEWLVAWCLKQDDPPISISRGKELLRFADMEQMREWIRNYDRIHGKIS